MFKVYDRVKFVNNYNKDLDGQFGVVLGYEGKNNLIVKFDIIPFGYNPVIVIPFTNLELV